jgi:hypothetical protein
MYSYVYMYMYRETVYQARFTNRIPYPVDISLDARQIKEFLNVKKIRDDKCQNFNWYLKEIYPGLEMDKKNVEILYKNHLASNYLEKKLRPLMDQYNKEISDVILNQKEILSLKKRQNVPEEIALKLNKESVEPKVYIYTYTHIFIYIYIHIYMYAGIFTLINAQLLYIHIYIHKYTYVYTGNKGNSHIT